MSHVSRRGFLAAASAAGGVGSGGEAGPAGRHEGPHGAAGRPGRSTTAGGRGAARRRCGAASGSAATASSVSSFEAAYAELTGAKHCLATANGTSALFASLGALGVGPGDEVIVPPYTFVATVNVVLRAERAAGVRRHRPRDVPDRRAQDRGGHHARTAAIMPVHLGGSAADLDAILAHRREAQAAGDRRRLPGPPGASGAARRSAPAAPRAASASRPRKNLNSGEGGAILTNDDELAEKCYAFHNNGRGRKDSGYDFTYAAPRRQPAHDRVPGGAAAGADDAARGAVATTRERERAVPDHHAARDSRHPSRRACTTAARATPTTSTCSATRRRSSPTCRARSSSRRWRRKASPARAATAPLNKEPFLQNTLHIARLPEDLLQRGHRGVDERNRCPENDRLCEEAVWFTQTMLLAGRGDMDQIAAGVRKVQAFASQLAI